MNSVEELLDFASKKKSYLQNEALQKIKLFLKNNIFKFLLVGVKNYYN